MGMPEVMRAQRHALGMSQAQLAALVGVTTRQIARYEKGEQQPALNLAVKLAESLQVSLDELAGQFADTPDLSGSWWMGWQLAVGDPRRWDPHAVIADHTRSLIRFRTDSQHTAGAWSVGWDCELRIHDRHTLVGWFHCLEDDPTGIGALYLDFDPDDEHGRGLWVGRRLGNERQEGRFALARTRQVLDVLLSVDAEDT
ncbi:MAG: helix-turn-helix transcriptional regulator [Actinomycetota bacterium]